ncbi:MAG: hypothetical protein KME27_07990 [Lyngbya sp. HA4199-MV5]|jgi:hypothetical protein|nr:hypothetical protein [Lyngbya sp. HA4199-MV5]
MAVSPEERFHQRQPRYSKEEFARRGDEIYESQVRSQAEEGNYDKIVAIDIETGAFEIGKNSIISSDLLLTHHPDAQIWFVRIGHRAVHRIGYSEIG